MSDEAPLMPTRAAADQAGIKWRAFRKLLIENKGPPLFHAVGVCGLGDNFVRQDEFLLWLKAHRKEKRDACRIEASRSTGSLG